MKRRENLSPARVRAARIIAIAADFVQIVVMPVFAGGFSSPVNDALDAAVAVAMILLVGWHWAFLPSFLSELIPFWDLVPTWTAAVFLVTRGQGRRPPGGTLEAELAPPRGSPQSLSEARKPFNRRSSAGIISSNAIPISNSRGARFGAT